MVSKLINHREDLNTMNNYEIIRTKTAELLRVVGFDALATGLDNEEMTAREALEFAMKYRNLMSKDMQQVIKTALKVI
jgi:hypothetical protein